jgi:hypothetical protein
MYTQFEIQKIAGIINGFFQNDTCSFGMVNYEALQDPLLFSPLPFLEKDFNNHQDIFLSTRPGSHHGSDLPAPDIINRLNKDFLKTQNSFYLISVIFYFENIPNSLLEGESNIDEMDNYLELIVYENQISVSGSFLNKDYPLSDEDIVGEENEIRYKKARNFCAPIFEKHLPEEEIFFDDWREGLQDFIRRISFMCIEASNFVNTK